MALKRRVERTYTLDEMMSMVNKHFIEQEKNRPVDQPKIRKFAIEPTCFDNDKWVVCDSRATSSEDIIAHEPQLLPTYYGSTILEAVTKCFIDRANHYNYVQANVALTSQRQPLPIKKLQIQKRSLVGMGGSKSNY